MEDSKERKKYNRRQDEREIQLQSEMFRQNKKNGLIKTIRCAMKKKLEPFKEIRMTKDDDKE